ncbi:MAG: hypothetical protein ACP5KB_05635 [Thermoprotei archaeon]
MLFDPKPKNSRSDLFDREEEISELKESIPRLSLTLLLSVRRVDEISALNELGTPTSILQI